MTVSDALIKQHTNANKHKLAAYQIMPNPQYEYERLNGMLGSIPNNHRTVEVQMMRKFLATQQIRIFGNCDDPKLREEFEPFAHRTGSLHHS